MTSSSATKARLPLTHRAKPSELANPAWYPRTERELDILLALADYHTLTTRQISTLFFPPRGLKTKSGRVIEQPRAAGSFTNAAREALKRLYHHEYIDRVVGIGRQTRYFLDAKGAKQIEKVTGNPVHFYKREKILSDTFIEHLEKTNDLWIAVALAVQCNGLRLLERLDEIAVRSAHTKRDAVEVTDSKGQRYTVTPVPDGFFRVSMTTPEPESFPFFIEADLGTEPVESDSYTRRSWERKVKAYLAYFASGKYEARYKTKAGRVLTVIAGSHHSPGEQRLAHMKAVTEQLGGKSRFWFTTFERMQGQDILTSAVWQIATREGCHAILAAP